MKDSVDRILNGEDIRKVLTRESLYGIDIIEDAAVYEMAKLIDKLADKSISGDVPGFIYFSPVLDSHGPRIKFYGGTKDTSSTMKAPSYTFGVDGPIQVKLQPWMNKSNCPNAFDKKCLKEVSAFITNHLALLLLIWFEKVDEAFVLAYFEGHLPFKDLLEQIEVFGRAKDIILGCKTENELYKVCKELDLYKFS